MKIAIVTHDGEGVPCVDQADAAAWEAIPDMNFSYASIMDIASHGVSLARGRVEPGMEVPPHAAETRYVLLVTSGTGTLTLMRPEVDSADCTISYAPGMLIDFPPKARHGWVNSGIEPFEWFGIDFANRT